MAYAQQLCYRPRRPPYSPAFSGKSPISSRRHAVLLPFSLFVNFFCGSLPLLHLLNILLDNIPLDPSLVVIPTLPSSLWPIYIIWCFQLILNFTCFNQLLETRKESLVVDTGLTLRAITPLGILRLFARSGMRNIIMGQEIQNFPLLNIFDGWKIRSLDCWEQKNLRSIVSSAYD